MSNITARVETEAPLTIEEGNHVRLVAHNINLATETVPLTLDLIEQGLRAAFPDWLVYRGGSHVALHRHIDSERVLLVEERREPEPRPRAAAPVAQRTDVSVGETFLIDVNQGRREAEVLAVKGDEYLVEYEMPRGSTALQIWRVGQTYGKTVSYRGLSRAWLQAIVDAESEWRGRQQGVFHRYRSGADNGKAVPSAQALLHLKLTR